MRSSAVAAALQAAAAGAQLYFPREDGLFLFVDALHSALSERVLASSRVN